MRRTYDSDSNLKEIVSDLVHFADPVKTKVLSVLFGGAQNAKPIPADSYKFYDNYVMYESATLAAAFTGSAENFFTGSSGDGAKFRPYDVVRVGDEDQYWQILTSNTSTNVITFTTTADNPVDGTAATVASGQKVYRIGGGMLQGVDLPSNELLRNETARTVYLEEIYHRFDISDRQAKSLKNFGGTERDNMLVKGTIASLKELDRKLIEGVENTTDSASRPQSFGGLWNKITTVATTSSFSETNLHTALATCLKGGYEASQPIMFVSPGLHGKLAETFDSQFQSHPIDGLVGLRVSMLETMLGSIWVIPTRYIWGNYGILVDRDKLELVVQEGNEFQLKQYGKDGNYEKYSIWGAYAMAISGCADSHFLFKFSS